MSNQEDLEQILVSLIKKKKVIHLRKIIQRVPGEPEQIIKALEALKEKEVIKETMHGGYRFFSLLTKEGLGNKEGNEEVQVKNKGRKRKRAGGKKEG